MLHIIREKVGAHTIRPYFFCNNIVNTVRPYKDV